ncbi:MAG: hypothetical protein QMD04_14545 [Anaerolineales bacterium]|nr:hypothetical protein [Anaerolineales bacterium]
MPEKLLNYEELLGQEVQHTPAEYWPNLLQLVRLFRETVTLNPAAQSFRQGWQETMSGQTQDIAHLWEGIDAE